VVDGLHMQNVVEAETYVNCGFGSGQHMTPDTACNVLRWLIGSGPTAGSCNNYVFYRIV